MKLAIVCPCGSGHLNPSLGLASELQSRGHEVCLAVFRDGEAKAVAAGIRHCVVAEDEFPRGQVQLEIKELGRHTGLKALRATADFLGRQHLADIRDLPRICEAEKFTGMLIDQCSNGAATVAQALRIPYVTIANALWFTRDLSMPSGSSDLTPAHGVFGRLKCRFSHLPMWLVTRSIFKPINQKRRALGLDNLTYRNWAESDLAIVSQLPKELEFPEMASPDHLHYTGPFFRSETREVDLIDWARFENRPLIYVSMGTAFNNIRSVFHAIAAACVGLDAQLLIALGDRGAQVGDGWPGTPVVVPHAPQLEVLKRATLVVTHAGLNTVLETLAHGVPMVALPVTGDQPAVAARMVGLGAGVALPV
ncbi:MAG: glycosyltransferase, partial [Pirellulaceae bacterium]